MDRVIVGPPLDPPADLDPFSLTLLPATAEAGLPLTTVSRHIPVLRRLIGPYDRVLLAARATLATKLGTAVLVVTARRLVVTWHGRLLGRVRPLLDLPLGELRHVAWTSAPTSPLVALTVVVHDVRIRLRVYLPDPTRFTDALTAALHTVPHPPDCPPTAVDEPVDEMVDGTAGGTLAGWMPRSSTAAASAARYP